MYEQRYIDLYDESYFDKIINNQLDNPVSIQKKDMRGQGMYYSFQHYLVKKCKNSSNKSKCKKYIMDYYNDFISYPYLFTDSPFIRNGNLDLLIDEESMRNKIRNYRDTYFDPNNARKLYNKKFKTPLTQDEKNRYYSFLLTRLNNEKFKDIIFKEIDLIIGSDFKSLSPIELQFYAQYVSNYARNTFSIKTTTHVVIGDNDSTSRGVTSNGFITIYKDAFNSIDLFTKTVCHETRHTYQYESSKNKVNKEAFDVATRNLFGKYLNTKDYNSYHDNYRYAGIELDAEREGHRAASIFFMAHERNDLADNVRNNRVNVFDKRHYYPFMKDSNGKSHPIDTFIVNNLDSIIANHPDEIKNYPVLKEIYDSNGKRKPYSVLFTERMEQSLFKRGIYEHYMFNGISNGEINTIDLSNSSDEYIKRFNQTLASIYRDAIFSNVKTYLYDKDAGNNLTPFYKSQVLHTTTYYISLAEKLLLFVNNNFDLLMFPYMNESIDNTNIPLFDLIYDFRDYSPDIITNPIIKNDPKIMNRLNDLKIKVDYITKKYNQKYIESRIKDLPEEVLNYSKDFSGIGTITFRDYCLNVLPNRLDGHQEMDTKTGKLYVGTYIRNSSASIAKKINDNRNL